ncbi:MAG: exocyst complex component exo70 [Piccolia ochrophora]|nr:MAG: exocyst complex component exo70 [Piccolia ochrophora]
MLHKARELARKPSKIIQHSRRKSKDVKGLRKSEEGRRSQSSQDGNRGAREQVPATVDTDHLAQALVAEAEQGSAATDRRPCAGERELLLESLPSAEPHHKQDISSSRRSSGTDISADCVYSSASTLVDHGRSTPTQVDASAELPPSSTALKEEHSIDKGNTEASSRDRSSSSREEGLLFPSVHLSAESDLAAAPLFCSCNECENEFVSHQQVTDRAGMMVGPRIASDEEDRAEVEVLHARLEKTVQLTKKIQASLNRLDTSGTAVKEAIGPIYGNTQKLQVLGTNIDRVNHAIDKLREPLDIRAKEDRIIRAGPQSVGLSDYLAALKRLNDALSRLKATNLRSNQDAIAELNSLVTTGSRQLEDVFRDILKQVSQAVEPLYHITKQKPFPTFTQDKASRLGLINSFTAAPNAQNSQRDNGLSPMAHIYAEVRGAYLTSTLANLAAASVTTTKKKSPDAIYRRGTNGVGTYATGIESLYLAEYDNVCSVFSRDSWGRVFNATFRSSLTEFAKTLRELNAHVKSNMITDCFLAYEVIDIVSNLSYNLDSKTGELKAPLLEALKPIRDTAKSSLPGLLDDIRRRVANIQVLPSDGATVPVTSDTMTTLQSLADYPSSLATIMISLGDGNWTSSKAASSNVSLPTLKSFDVGADGRQLLTHYVTDALDTLFSALESKGRALLKTKSIAGVFLANNVAIADRMLRTSELTSVLGGATAVHHRLDTWRKKGISLYLDAWKDPSAFLLDVQYTNRGSTRPPSGNAATVNSAEIIKGLGSKDKDAIKEKFRGFNASFDDLVARHRALGLEREVRSLLAREVQAMIEPLYGRFWDRYHEIDKGKAKYVKYDKGSLAGVLAQLA